MIWAKKSSGQPIRVQTAHAKDSDSVPSSIHVVVLDIDIYKNEPRIHSKKAIPNHSSWRGTEIALTMVGQWSVYKSKILQYLQQLAVITPYAKFSLSFTCVRDEKKSFDVTFDRRSDQMPATPQIMLPHPHSLNHITFSKLLSECKPQELLSKVLLRELCCISSSVIGKLFQLAEIADSVTVGQMNASMITRLLQAFRQDNLGIRQPSVSCLSPAGEYNLRLG